MTTPHFVTASAKWDALRSRNPQAHSSFFYGVKSTGIFCRPTCHARLARRINVEFFNTTTLAVQAGYRACKRCRPELPTYAPSSEKVSAACRRLALLPRLEDMPRLDSLAAEVGLTKHHFHRMFKRTTGMTPKEFASAHQPLHCKGQGNELSVGSTRLKQGPVVGCESLEANDSAPGAAESGNTGNQLRGEATIFDDIRETVWYNCIHTKFGVLFVAMQNRQICALELANNTNEALESVSVLLTPTTSVKHISLMTGSQVCEFNKQANAIVEALERPKGKMLNLTMSVNMHHLLYAI